MRKILPILLAATVYTTSYLTPLYPVYAQDYGENPGQGMRPQMQPPQKLMGKPGLIQASMSGNMTGRPKMGTPSAAFLEKLAKFKDKNKAKRLELVNANLNTVNGNVTGEMQKTLTRLSGVLEKLKTIASEAEAKGQDVTAVNQAISDAQSAWNQANDALTDQLDNDYSITVTDETTAQTAAMEARNALKTDLQSVHSKIMDAKGSLGQAIQSALSSLKGGNTNGTN